MAFISFVLLLAIIIYYFSSKDFDQFYKRDEETLSARISTRKKYTSKIKWLVIIFIISVFGSVFIPNKNEAIIIIAGAKTIDFIQKDESINKIPSQTTLLISKFLEDNINKLDSINDPLHYESIKGSYLSTSQKKRSDTVNK
jgi:hypothetical protein